MPANAFDTFMAQHPATGELVRHANAVLWEESAMHPVVKERMRIALAEAVGCSYCARFRTAVSGELSEQDVHKAELAEAFGRAVVAGTADDELTMRMQEHFPPAEFADLVFSIGWFIGMQHVGRLMHWDDACPVAPIRALVEAGAAA
jgi:hypothetical protein